MSYTVPDRQIIHDHGEGGTIENCIKHNTYVGYILNSSYKHRHLKEELWEKLVKELPIILALAGSYQLAKEPIALYIQNLSPMHYDEAVKLWESL